MISKENGLFYIFILVTIQQDAQRKREILVNTLINLSKMTYKKMLQNLRWATGYNVFAIPLGVGVLYGYGILISPAIGALLMSLSTIIVAINAKLMVEK